MSRTLTITILAVVAALVLGALGIVAVLFGRNFFQRDDGTATLVPTIPAVTVTVGVPTPSPTATPPGEVAGATPTAEPTVIVAQPTATTAPPTAISVVTTSVEYIMAQTDVNIRSGPGTGYSSVGWVAEGQIAKVTGVSSDNGWWRVICPDGSTGSCWVTAGAQFTQPTTAPGSAPTATAIATSCTDSAALVSDVTVTDGTQFAPNTGFNKTWRIRNSGTCTWDGRYGIIHAGGHLLGAVSTYFPLRDDVFPGDTVDLTINMVSPTVPDTYQSDWKLQNPQGQFFGVGRNSSPFWVKIVVVTGPNTVISGVVYQDSNQNGVYNSGETVVGNREIWLVPGTACQVRQNAVATAVSDGSGRYTFSGSYEGSFCVGLAGTGGLDDVAGIAIARGQTMTDINLRVTVSSSSITGFLWNDYCLTNEAGDALGGSCVADANGDYHANGMIEPTESYIAGVTVLLQAGPCGTDNPTGVTAVTEAGGRYFFGNLAAGTYCVSVNAAAPGNASTLLPGDWTFPARGIWYQQVTLSGFDNAYPVNFGWDYQRQ